MTDEEALEKARAIVGKFDMRLRDRGASAYAQMSHGKETTTKSTKRQRGRRRLVGGIGVEPIA
jgi:hypothetical protein